MPVPELVFVLVVLLGIAMLATGVCRKLPVPFTVVLVVIGVLLSSLAERWTLLEPLQHFELSPQVMLFIFLPALIFESGFALDARQMKKDLPAILVLAIPAMLISTFIVGLGVWLLLDTRLIVALVFGALISATDPVAVVALFKELGAPNRLNVLVEGESLLNDATAIVAFSILLGIAVEGSDIGWSDADNILLEFVKVFIGGALFGSLLGFLSCELLYRIKSTTTVILTTSIIIAYASFVVAEHILHVSGVMAVVGSAIALRSFGMSRFRHNATHSISETWEVIALSCNSLLFLMVGLSVNTGDIASIIGPVSIAIILVLIARALSVYSLVPLATRWFRLPHVSKAERHIMWWGGLKGGLAIAVVLSIPADLPERQFLFDLTIGVVMFTLLISAPTIRPLMERLGMDRLSDGEKLEIKSSLINARSKSQAYASKLLQSKVVPKASTEHLSKQIRSTFMLGWFDEDSDKHDDDEYLALLRSYHVERKELQSLYETSFISRYIYLDMLNRLYSMREALRLGESELETHRENGQQSFFQNLEGGFLRRIRELRWSSGILTRYQRIRIVQQIQRNLAHVIMCDSVLAMLDEQEDLNSETREQVKSVYRERKKHYRRHLKYTKQLLPSFYYRYRDRLATRSVIVNGWNYVKAEYSHNDLGAKGFFSIQRKVLEKLKHLDMLKPTVPGEEEPIAAMLEDIELFDELSDSDRDTLVKNAASITFLTGDNIIGANEAGDHFYVIAQGKASVWRTDALNTSHHVDDLSHGDIIGESSLLTEQGKGRHIRSATIRAEMPCTVIRVSMRPMLLILKKYPGIRRKIRQVHDSRGADRAPRVSDN